MNIPQINWDHVNVRKIPASNPCSRAIDLKGVNHVDQESRLVNGQVSVLHTLWKVFQDSGRKNRLDVRPT